MPVPAVHRTWLVPTGKVLPDGGSQRTQGVAPHSEWAWTSNVAVAMPAASASRAKGPFGQSSWTHAGHSSVTTTLNVSDDWLPERSRATQVTVLVPMAKRLPLGGLHSRTTGEQASVASTTYRTGAPLVLAQRTMSMPGGRMAGGVESRTVTWNEHSTALPRASLAMVRTVVVPGGKIEPDFGTETTLAISEQDEAARTENWTMAPSGEVHSAVMSAGHAMVTHGRTCA